MGNKIRLPDGTEFDPTIGEFDSGRTTSTGRSPQPARYIPSTHYPYHPRTSSWDIHPLIFYIITLVLSAAATWGLSIFVSILFFDKNIFGFSNVPDWFDSIEGFLLNIAPYLILLGGIAGCLFYNIKKSDFDSFKDIILPVLSAVAASLILCIIAAVLTLIIVIVIEILKVIIPIIIGIIVVFILIGA
jgi:hypothetical protein